MTLQAAFLLQRLLNQAGAESHRLGGEGRRGWAAGGLTGAGVGPGGWDKVTGEEKVGEVSRSPAPGIEAESWEGGQ